jgi:hypothetical protein
MIEMENGMLVRSMNKRHRIFRVEDLKQFPDSTVILIEDHNNLEDMTSDISLEVDEDGDLLIGPYRRSTDQL